MIACLAGGDNSRFTWTDARTQFLQGSLHITYGLQMKFRTLSLSLYSQMSFDNLCGEFYFPRLDITVSTLESLPALLPVGIFLTILMVMSEDNGELC